MSNREAINQISRNKSVFKHDTAMLKALDLAIKALEERPQGEWIISQTMDCHSDIINIYTCPFCGKREYSAYPYCHCGAKLKGEEE